MDKTIVAAIIDHLRDIGYTITPKLGLQFNIYLIHQHQGGPTGIIEFHPNHITIYNHDITKRRETSFNLYDSDFIEKLEEALP